MLALVTVQRVKGTPSTARGPVVFMYEITETVDGKPQKVKVTHKYNYGSSFTVPAQVAYEIAAKYPGLVTISNPKEEAAEGHPQVDRAEKAYTDGAPKNMMLKKEATK